MVWADHLENHHDRDQSDDDRQHAALAVPDANHICPRVFAERLGNELGRNFRLRRPGGGGEVGCFLRRSRHQFFALASLRLRLPFVMYSTTLWRSNAVALSWITIRPR
jgi:hypothetical protein